VGGGHCPPLLLSALAARGVSLAAEGDAQRRLNLPPAHTRTHSCSHSHSYAHSHAYAHSHSHSYFHSLPNSHTYSPSHSHSHGHSLSTRWLQAAKARKSHLAFCLVAVVFDSSFSPRCSPCRESPAARSGQSITETLKSKPKAQSKQRQGGGSVRPAGVGGRDGLNAGAQCNPLQTPVAQGRSTKLISTIKWTRTSRLSIKISLSPEPRHLTPQTRIPNPESRGRLRAGRSRRSPFGGWVSRGIARDTQPPKHTRHTKHETRNPEPGTRKQGNETRDPKREKRKPKPHTRFLIFGTPDLKPQTANPRLQTPNL
jgi:hypothetical protein